jgi:allantoinase
MNAPNNTSTANTSRAPLPRAFPNGARIAVMISLLLESWSEGKAPGYFPRTTPLKPGKIDHAAARWSEYGGKEGIWRLLRIVDERGLRASVFANALAAERYPEAIRQIVKSGHAIEGHGYAQDQSLMDLDPDAQHALIKRSLDVIESQSGRRPSGWMSPAYSNDQHTAGLLALEKLRWHCDALDRSLPARESTPHGDLIAVPWSDYVDNRTLRGNPADYLEVYKNHFNYLYEQEPLGLVHIACHAHSGGRPSVAAIFDKVLRYVGGHRGVWFTTPADMAQWMLDQHIDSLPYSSRFTA